MTLMDNKIDLPNRTHVKFYKKQYNMAYFAIPYLENKNINEPLLWLLGEVFGDVIVFLKLFVHNAQKCNILLSSLDWLQVFNWLVI